MSDDFLQIPDEDEETAAAGAPRAYFPAGLVADIPAGKSRSIWVKNRKVAVFNVKGTLLACRDRCTHMGAPLSDGHVSGKRVVCGWHGWTFDLETGTCTNKEWASVETYRVRVVGDRFEVEVPIE
jgi:nitrite reductase/ring-hydroxylating ferredoxin subunit